MGSTRWWCSASARCCSWPACSPACCPRCARRACTRCMPCATTRDRRHATEPFTEDEGMNIWLTEIWRSWRASLRRPGFLLLASGVLALGIGASVSVFALIDHVLLRPLPYADAGQLIALGPVEQEGISEISPQQYQHMQPIRGIASMGLIRDDLKPVNVAGVDEPEQVDAFLADRGLLSTLGVRMRLGRGFSEQEDRPGGPRAVILSEGYWR